MKTNTLILVLLAVGGAYLYLSSQNQQPFADRTNATAGGSTASQPDVFTSILGAVTGIFNAVGNIAQTTPKTN